MTTQTQDEDTDNDQQARKREFVQGVTRDALSYLLEKKGIHGVHVTKAPTDGSKGKQKLSPEEIENLENRLGDENFYNKEEKPDLKKSRIGFSFRKKKTSTITIAATGAITIAIGFFTITPQFKVPSIMGDLQIHIPSGLIMRTVVEKSFKRIMTRYLIAKAAGNLDQAAKPGSQLSRFYKILDETDAVEKVFRDTGVRFKKVGGEVRAFHDGKELGPANNHKQVVALEKKYPATFGKAYGEVIERVYPGIRLVLSVGPFNRLKVVYNLAFGTRYDDSKSREENWQAQQKREVQQVQEGKMRNATDIIQCLASGDPNKCPKRSTDPVDPNNPSARQGVSFGGGDADKMSTAAGENLQQGFDQTLASPLDENYNKRLTDYLFKVFANAASSKALTASIPVIGWIDTVAQIDHALELAATRHLVTDTAILMKEESYAKIAGMWLGYADEIKDGSMHWSFRFGLAERITGYEASETAAFLYGGDPSKRIPVGPKVGSSSALYNAVGNGIDNVLGCSETANNNAQANIFSEYLNYTRCNSHQLLDLWYKTVSQALGAIGDFTSMILYFLWEYGPVNSVLVAMFGQDWQQRMFAFAFSAIFDMMGLTINPLAKGGELYNNIYTGSDVINNGYLQANLGAYEVSPEVAAANLKVAQEEYQKSVATLPLRERLFSLDVPGSLTNQLIIAAPASPDPSAMVASIAGSITSLPATFMSLISGHSWASTYQQRADLTGAAQMGMTLQEMDSDIPIEVIEQADPQCPPNQPGKHNNCQKYKEILNYSMCVDPGCAALPKY